MDESHLGKVEGMSIQLTDPRIGCVDNGADDLDELGMTLCGVDVSEVSPEEARYQVDKLLDLAEEHYRVTETEEMRAIREKLGAETELATKLDLFRAYQELAEAQFDPTWAPHEQRDFSFGVEIVTIALHRECGLGGNFYAAIIQLNDHAYEEWDDLVFERVKRVVNWRQKTI